MPTSFVEIVDAALKMYLYDTRMGKNMYKYFDFEDIKLVTFAKITFSR